MKSTDRDLFTPQEGYGPYYTDFYETKFYVHFLYWLLSEAR